MCEVCVKCFMSFILLTLKLFFSLQEHEYWVKISILLKEKLILVELHI